MALRSFAVGAAVDAFHGQTLIDTRGATRQSTARTSSLLRPLIWLRCSISMTMRATPPRAPLTASRTRAAAASVVPDEAPMRPVWLSLGAPIHVHVV
jgi:hypothetical protein